MYYEDLVERVYAEPKKKKARSTKCRFCKKRYKRERTKNGVCDNCFDWWEGKRKKIIRERESRNAAYDKMMASGHSGNCDICGRPPNEARRHCVDHNHSTGAIRGLLCYTCNYGLHWFRDKPELMESAAKYLFRFEK